MKRITFDFETRAWIDLKSVGAYKYSLHPLTQPTCLAFKVRGNATVYFLDFEVVNRSWKKLPKELRDLWLSFIEEGYEFAAHNAFFERCIYQNILVKRYGWPKLPPSRYRCTAAKAAACAIPRGLEGAGEALGLSIQKDKRGYNAMMATCKPTRGWTAWTKAKEDLANGVNIGPKKRALVAQPEPPMFLEPGAAPEVWRTLYTYCKIDVRAEEALDIALPDLIPLEQKVWHLNQKLNWRGITVDLPTVRKIYTMLDTESREKREQLDRLTMGLVKSPHAIRSILEFLELDGVELPNLQKKTIEDQLDGFMLSPDMRTLLEIRKALSMVSTRKYKAFLDRADEHGRIRDLVLYHGASTGRDGGTGINIYNFPRGLLKFSHERPYAAVENVASCGYELLKILYGGSLGVLFSSILRNMIVAWPGYELFVADFSKIELVILWWLADNVPGLEILKAKLDPYRYQAAANTGKDYAEIGKESDERQLGKAQILGCGFRMGWKKFQMTAWTMYRLKLTSRQSLNAVKSYREANPAVVQLWDLYEDAAIEAVESGKKVSAGKCEFEVRGRFLWVKLPSGRSLAYLEPSITMRTITYTALEQDQRGNDIEVERVGREKKTLSFLGLDKSKKKMQTEFSHGGIITENIVQAAARDVMMERLLVLEDRGYKVLLSVYDEGVCQRPIGEGSVGEFTRLMCEPPAWGLDIPLEANGWAGPRYRK